ncbi:phage portal protein [Salinibacterium sp. G-O1]|uniref:phage portal protein n=1 Tax=Salinibacterium sp. G-O1 TaxID=3046208 RepID=UPI0024BA2504|nr:phage portal protein [Salinibacterium sp. G-O1]MDJ0336433.1 phage portal protein [Salinibacterium sp. G-O1]
MGLLDLLGLGRQRPDYLATLDDFGLRSPWAEGSLAAIVYADVLGADAAAGMPLSRAEAIQIPAVSKARNLLVSTIAKLPLVALDKDGALGEQPTWLYRTDGLVSPYERLAWTVDDLIFYGVSLWLTERGAAGQILNAEWCPPQLWKITDGHVLVNDIAVDSQDYILFNPPFEGLLNVGSRTLKGARDTEKAWTGRMRNPIPLIELKVTDDSNLTQAEVDAYVKAWAAARQAENGGVSFTPAGMEVRVHGEVKADLMQEGRNAIRTDVGSFLNVRAALLDGTTGIDSLTYTTKDGEKNSFYELDLPFWTNPIEHALSVDKVVPRGQRVRFDRIELDNPVLPTGVPTED